MPGSATTFYVGLMGTKDKEREERLAAALRENLRRRKAQARELDSKPDEPSRRD